MQRTMDKLFVLWLRSAVVVLGVLWCSPVFAQPADSLSLDLLVPNFEQRPFVVSEIHGLSGGEVDVDAGFVSENGRLQLSWPNDGNLHLFKLRCSGVEWSLSVCGPEPEVQRLLAPRTGLGPFSARPGELAVEASQASTPLVLGQFSNALEGLRAEWAVEFQRSRLWGDGQRKNEAAEVLGAGMDVEEPEALVAKEERTQDDALQFLDSVLQSAIHRHGDGRAQPVLEYMAAMSKSLEVELVSERLSAFDLHWSQSSAPDPTDAASVLNFITGVNLFARTDNWSEDAASAYATAVQEADFEALVKSTSAWWGGADPDKTAAWLLYRLGRDGFDVQKPGFPFSVRSWSLAWEALIADQCDHPVYGGEFRNWRNRERAQMELPAQLRAFNAGEELIRLDELVGSGPAVWLWVDAAAPSTTLQIQVLEKMLASKEGRKLQRDMQWVLADAGTDFAAFQQLIRLVAKRSGGLSKMPFLMVHTGADVRLSRAFDLLSLPAIRMHGSELSPVSAHLPLPGPDLMLWLARRP